MGNEEAIKGLLQRLADDDAVPPGSESIWTAFLRARVVFASGVESNFREEELRQLALDAGEIAMKIILFYPRLATHDGAVVLRTSAETYIKIRAGDRAFMDRAPADEVVELGVVGERLGLWPRGPINLASLKGSE